MGCRLASLALINLTHGRLMYVIPDVGGAHHRVSIPDGNQMAIARQSGTNLTGKFCDGHAGPGITTCQPWTPPPPGGSHHADGCGVAAISTLVIRVGGDAVMI
jgi:hypothetical protein